MRENATTSNERSRRAILISRYLAPEELGGAAHAWDLRQVRVPGVGGDAVLRRDPDTLGSVDAQGMVAVGVTRGPDQRAALAELDVAVDEDNVVGAQVLDAVGDV